MTDTRPTVYDETIKRSWVDQYYTEVEHVQQRFNFFLISTSFLLVAFVTLIAFSKPIIPQYILFAHVIAFFGVVSSLYFQLIDFMQARVVDVISRKKYCEPIPPNEKNTLHWIHDCWYGPWSYMLHPITYTKDRAVSHTWFVPFLFFWLWLVLWGVLFGFPYGLLVLLIPILIQSMVFFFAPDSETEKRDASEKMNPTSGGLHMSKGGWLLFGLACLAVAVGWLIAFIAPEKNIQRISTGANITLTAGLFLVTAFYAKKTSDIATETRQQAEATTASVIEMQKQRYLATQPWVFPQLLKDDGQFADPVPLVFMNVGSGPAMDLKPFISDGDPTKIQDEWKRKTGPSYNKRIGPMWSAVQAGSTISWQRAFEDPRPGTTGVIAVEYQDIYGRIFLSGWAYRIEKVEGGRLALIPVNPLFPIERT